MKELKLFKCVNPSNHHLTKGKVYIGKRLNDSISVFNDNTNLVNYNDRRFELIENSHINEFMAYQGGANIEVLHVLHNKWVSTSPPLWDTKNEYRVKPIASVCPREIEKQAILKEMGELKTRLEALEVK